MEENRAVVAECLGSLALAASGGGGVLPALQAAADSASPHARYAVGWGWG